MGGKEHCHVVTQLASFGSCHLGKVLALRGVYYTARRVDKESALTCHAPLGYFLKASTLRSDSRNEQEVVGGYTSENMAP